MPSMAAIESLTPHTAVSSTVHFSSCNAQSASHRLIFMPSVGRDRVCDSPHGRVLYGTQKGCCSALSARRRKINMHPTMNYCISSCAKQSRSPRILSKIVPLWQVEIECMFLHGHLCIHSYLHLESWTLECCWNRWLEKPRNTHCNCGEECSTCTPSP